MPTNMQHCKTKSDWVDEAVSIAYIQTMMCTSRAKTKILIVDACRDRGPQYDPVANADAKSPHMTRAKISWATINQTDSGGNMVTIYSSSEATVSFAGDSTTLSVMTKQLVKLINEPGITLCSL
eukprot:UN02199